jgi:fatty acid desaturase
MNEVRFNTHSVIAFVVCVVAGCVLVALGHHDWAQVPFAFAAGVAALPQLTKGS